MAGGGHSPRHRGDPGAGRAPQPAVWLSPLAVLREPAECFLMFPFAFGCRLESVFSFSGWCHLPPTPIPLPAGSLVCCGRKVPGLPELSEDRGIDLILCVPTLRC